jgi:inhibitor of KinA
VRFCAASDQALLVYFADEISLAAHEQVLKLLQSLRNRPPAWLRNLQPAYTSLMVTFDLSLIDHGKVEAEIRSIAECSNKVRCPKTRLLEIPVCYGDEFGPDLKEVARSHGLPPSEVVAIHSSPTYHAYFLGFAPGFAYLGDVPAQIATPRLETPRREVPAGSIAIAEKQTAVYPFATPGGWRLIGRTPLSMFQIDRDPMPTIMIGDKVQFRPISRKQFLEMQP